MEPSIAWLPWGTEAFARADRERRPILLSIAAAWCGACHEMDRTTYARRDVAAIVHDRFVPVRVDADQRPDINERYNLGGWPTTAFLTPRGRLITGGTFVPADRMPGVLARVAAEYAAYSEGRADAEDDPDAEIEHAERIAREYTGAEVVDAVFSTFDDTFGGFGVEPKFPHTAPLHLAMALYADGGGDRWRTIVERTLDGMADGALWDPRGGFCRYATTRDWQLPHRERLLDINAALLRVYAEAAEIFGRGVDRDRSRRIVDFLTTTLAASGGGFYGSDADRILYLDANATASGALLAAAAALDDPAIAREALGSFERVLLACYRPGAGVAHYFDGASHVRGLLVDQVAAIGALLDAFHVSGGEPYRMMAQELALIIVRDLHDGADGGFFDRTIAEDDCGLLRQRRKPFLVNADAARALARVSTLEARPGFPDPAAFAAHAQSALRCAARQLDGQGPLAAHYALAARLLIK